jgi:hypothetical protein
MTISFLDLPVELRLPIYELLLVVPHDIRFDYQYEAGACTPSIRAADHAYGDRKIGRTVHSGILRTCRQINSEASSMLYKMNRFNFERARCSHFVDMIGSHAMSIFHVGLFFPWVDPGLEGLGEIRERDMQQICQMRAKTGASTFEIFLDPDAIGPRRAKTANDLITVDRTIRGLGGVDKIVLTIERYRKEVPRWLSEPFVAEARKLHWDVNERKYFALR